MSFKSQVFLLGTLLGLSLASIHVLHPKDLRNRLKNDGLIQASLGNFGHIVYGSSIHGRIFQSTTNADGCREFWHGDFPPEFYNHEESDMSPIIMVDRGNCTFVQKVRNIEKKGIKLAIIADTTEENTENLIMTDDGTGHSITIPSFIIRKKDADLIKQFIKNEKNSQNVYIKASLDIVHPDNRVEYEYWYSSPLDFDYDTLVDIALYQKILGKSALFTPRVLTYSCANCAEEVKKAECINNGLYCPYRPNGQAPKHLRDIDGRTLMEESLRQRCIYDTLAKQQITNQTYTTWYNYIFRFLDTCTDDVSSFNKECADRAMVNVGIDLYSVDRCLEQANQKKSGSSSTYINRLLDEDRKWAQQLGIILHPAITVNNITYRGELDGHYIFKAICAGFLVQPDICKGDRAQALISMEDNGELLYHRRSLVKVYHIIAAVVLVILINFLALAIYRKYQKRKVNEELHIQVNSAVSQYFKLSGTESTQI